MTLLEIPIASNEPPMSTESTPLLDLGVEEYKEMDNDERDKEDIRVEDALTEAYSDITEGMVSEKGDQDHSSVSTTDEMQKNGLNPECLAVGSFVMLYAGLGVFFGINGMTIATNCLAPVNPIISAMVFKSVRKSDKKIGELKANVRVNREKIGSVKQKIGFVEEKLSIKIDNLDGKVDENGKKIDENSKKIEKLSEKVDKNSEKIDQNSKKIDKLSEKVDKNSGKIDSLSREVGGIRTEVGGIRTDVRNLSTDVRNLTEMFNRVVVAVIEGPPLQPRPCEPITVSSLTRDIESTLASYRRAEEANDALLMQFLAQTLRAMHRKLDSLLSA